MGSSAHPLVGGEGTARDWGFHRVQPGMEGPVLGGLCQESVRATRMLCTLWVSGEEQLHCLRMRLRVSL